MAWALSAATRDALHNVIGARRDIRRFRPDAVPVDVLERVLRAGHGTIGPQHGSEDANHVPRRRASKLRQASATASPCAKGANQRSAM